MTAKHTPGPWGLCSIQGKNDLMVGAGCDLSDIVADIRRHHKEYYLNAALIAAAPELLAALENAANVLAGIATGDLKTIGKDSPALGQARAAIAKARGE